MLTPHKHMNLDASVIRVASLMIRELARRRTIQFEILRKRIGARVGPDCDLVFLPAINFLFLLGRVTYHEKNDLVEYRED